MSASTTSRPAPAPARGRLPAPVRDRRPALAALALLLVLVGALTSALVAYRSGDRVDVLVAAREIPVGSVVELGDFAVARVAADSAGSVLPVEARANFVGSRATTTVPAGTLVNRGMFRAGSVVPDDGVVVGVVLTGPQRPVDLDVNDVVRVFAVPAEGVLGATGTVLASAVRVVEVEVSRAGDSLKVSLLISAEQAARLVVPAANGQIAVTRLSSDTEPAVDFVEP